MNTAENTQFIGLVEDAYPFSTIRIFPQFRRQLIGLENFSLVSVLFLFPRNSSLLLDTHNSKTVVANPSETSNDPIGLCVVELVELNGCTLTVKGLKGLAGSLILTIRPYVSKVLYGD